VTLPPSGVILQWGATPEPWQTPTKLDECVTWLTTLLRESATPLAPKDIVAEARTLAFSRAMVYRAREVLGDQVRNTAGRRDPQNLWEWCPAAAQS